MAEAVFGTGWIPIEFSPDVIQLVKQTSAVEMFGQNIPMKTLTRQTPRSGGVVLHGITKGGTYQEDSTTNDEITLVSQKVGGAVRVAEEDLEDSLADIVNTKNSDAGTAYAKLFDNGSLAATGVNTGYNTASSGAEPNWAFPSLYYTLTQADSATGYTANANLNKTTSGSGLQYVDLSNALGILEDGNQFDPNNVLAIAHPAARKALRNILDKNGRPIFGESSNGTAGGGTRNVNVVLDVEIKWSLGARTNAYPTQSPTGNPLIIFCNPLYMQKGNRSPLEVQFIDGTTGLAALTDEAILKFRARKAFAAGHQGAFSILEIQP
jgi:HK97 family phage major capsid protein